MPRKGTVMAEPVASTPIRYSFGADEHLFAEVS
ncbi:MAG: allophanate hydrolase, partial [Pseudomonas capeferrum]